MKKYNVARFGMIAGWLTLAGILAFSVIGPNVIAGQRVSGSFDAAAIKAYYSHEGLLPLSAMGFVILLTMIPFVTSLRSSLAATDRAVFSSKIGYAFAITAIPLYAVSNTMQIVLVGVAAKGGDIVPLFRLWDVIYNSAAYIPEAGYAVFFALAMRDEMQFPRWMPKVGLVVGLFQLINASAIFVGIPDSYTMAGNLLLMLWFVGANIGLGRLGSQKPALS